jgi:hypothetical protein
MQLADANGDGALNAQEMKKVPGLIPSRPALDADADGKLTAAEIEAWLTRIATSRVAITPGSFTVMWGGRPLPNASVKLVPEPFMGAGMRSAEGVTDAAGIVNPKMAGQSYHGVNPGLYRVEVVGAAPDGNPLPAKFNTASTLGMGFGSMDMPEFSPSLSLE